jgi:polysaccharide pyruvyl transferase CsaB
VLSADPAGTAALHGVEARPRSPAEVWRALAGASLLISGGGSLVQDVTSLRSPLYYLGVMHAAHLRGVPVAVVGQGIGPLRRRWLRRLAAGAYNRARLVSVRDEDSAQVLAGMGVCREVHRGADLALLAQPEGPERVGAMLARAGLGGGRGIMGIAVREWPGLRSPAELGQAAREFARDRGFGVVVLPFDRMRDRAVSHAMAQAAGGSVVEANTPQDLLGLVGATEVMLAARLHALVFAVAQGVPAVGLEYDPKVAGFLRGPDPGGLLGILLPIDAPGPQVAHTLARVWEDRARQRARLREALPRLRALAASGVDAVARLLHEPAGSAL